MIENNNAPLAERLRAKSLEDFVGQEHLVGKNGVIRKMIETGNLSSFILWGPPGVGKTTLARIISSSLNRPFYPLSAINAGVKEVREVIDKAKTSSIFKTNRPILFIDEIHRFSKNQQDALLGAVEEGLVTLIGATTENPSFEVITPLLSRCQVYLLYSLDNLCLDMILSKALEKDLLLNKQNITVKEKDAIFSFSGGDGRKLLNILELVVNNLGSNETKIITNEVVAKILQEKIAIYDKGGEQHYDIISAFIKSMRGSDPDASVYWLARMIEGGEDPLFIARRMIILASEDIGLANPNALLIANACFESVQKIGMPESRIILSQTVIYLATSIKSNSAYMAIDSAIEEVKKSGNLSVPLHLRNSPTNLMKKLGYGLDYKYAHSYDRNFIVQDYLPKELKTKKFYIPGQNTKEESILKFLDSLWKNEK